MKKIISVLLMITVILTFAGCGSSNNILSSESAEESDKDVSNSNISDQSDALLDVQQFAKQYGLSRMYADDDYVLFAGMLDKQVHMGLMNVISGQLKTSQVFSDISDFSNIDIFKGRYVLYTDNKFMVLNENLEVEDEISFTGHEEFSAFSHGLNKNYCVDPNTKTIYYCRTDIYENDTWYMGLYQTDYQFQDQKLLFKTTANTENQYQLNNFVEMSCSYDGSLLYFTGEYITASSDQFKMCYGVYDLGKNTLSELKTTKVQMEMRPFLNGCLYFDSENNNVKENRNGYADIFYNDGTFEKFQFNQNLESGNVYISADGANICSNIIDDKEEVIKNSLHIYDSSSGEIIKQFDVDNFIEWLIVVKDKVYISVCDTDGEYTLKSYEMEEVK
ncbi:Uncharacterised protein [uncultured Roseburia sp.]|uniref:DUF5050 domain-containing protein n=1 Tax=Brotonthovivens ammoniilytica TaxID=2981725 RepID=A0ABT2THL3_9FIRM|nr:hypothetical protein [Brotonthovivens ammoniilytica]MCU6761683.1 hypothetical protein [Brotonthovivens ammoniilytica]SCI43447.1 Uncharacterised protein [uncultured Roseburia sp.]